MKFDGVQGPKNFHNEKIENGTITNDSILLRVSGSSACEWLFFPETGTWDSPVGWSKFAPPTSRNGFFLLFFFLDMAAVVFCSGSLPGSITTRNRALNVKDRPTRVVDRWRHQTQLNWISVYTLKSFTGYLLPTKFDHGLLGFTGTTRAYRISIIISIVFPIWVGICQFNRSLPGYFFLGYTGVQWFWFSFTGDYEKARWKQWSGWLFKHRLVAAGTTFKRPPPIGQHESHISPCIPPAGVRVFRYALTGFFSDIGVSLTISQWPVMTARSTFDSWRCPWPLSNHFDGGYTSGLVFPKVEKIIRSGGSRSCRVE